MTPSAQRAEAIGMLLLTNVLWAVSFPLSKSVEQLQGGMAPGSGTFITAYTLAPRFVIALAVLLIFSRLGRRRDDAAITRLEWRQGLIMGMFNFGGMLMQIDGLRFTAASTSAFLTLTYAMLIPVWLAIRFRRNPGFIVWVSCALVLTGVAILGRFDWHTLRLGRGELETLLGSIMFMAQILCLPEKKYAANRAAQTTLVMFILEVPLFLILLFATAPSAPALLTPWSSPPWIVLTLALTGFCTIAGYSIMNTWQPKITATEAGLLNCSEPVFTAILVLFLPGLFSLWAHISYPNEHASRNLLIGGSLITIANVLIQVSRRPANAPR